MQYAIQEQESAAYLRYGTSRDKPHGRAVSKILTELVDWVDATYIDDTHSARSARNRCRARVVKRSVPLDGIHRVDTKIAVHGSYQACDRKTLHPDPFFGIALVHMEDFTCWGNTIFTSILDTHDLNSTIVASTTLNTEYYKPDDETGLEMTSKVCWDRKFQAPSELEDHFDTLRQLAVGHISMGKAFDALIRQPAISEGYTVHEFPCDIHAPLVEPGNAQILTFPH